MAIFDFIEGWYNPHRRHSALGYFSPPEFERFYRDQAQSDPEELGRSAHRLAATKHGGHGAAASDPKHLTLSGPPSNQVKGGAEKLVSDQYQDVTYEETKPVN